MKKLLSIFILSSAATTSYAALEALDDAELGVVEGAGMGIVFEGFSYESQSGSNLKISGLENSSGQDVELNFPRLYISGDNSNRGSIISGVNLGRLLHPFYIDIKDGDDASVGIPGKSVFEIGFPEKLAAPDLGGEACVSGADFGRCSSRSGFERIDMGFEVGLTVNNVQAQSLQVHQKGVAMDGSKIRFWGGEENKLTFDLRLHTYAQQLELFACNASGNNCGDSVVMTNYANELAIGYGSYQPVTFEVLPDGHFVLEVASLQGKCASTNATGGCDSGTSGYAGLNDFYQNGPQGNIYIGDVSIGGESFGTSTIENLQIQYLHVQSHDL